ncbi:MAG: LarC family nickel insertion protein, partial [Vulcanococcus sp.]
MEPASPLAVIDCPTGLAGNMLLAALLDAGLPQAVVQEPLAALGLADAYRLELEERRSGGLRGLHLAVALLEEQPHHRHWGTLREQIASAALEPALKERVLQVFGLLAEAEASVHGHAPEQVHFHEVGAIDALVDVVGVCAGLLAFGVKQLICTPPPAGHGQVTTAHGLLPLPAPAVLELARRHGVPLASSEGFPRGELTTPTGLALMAAWAERFSPAPALCPRAVGVGLGSRSLDRPNLLRLILAESTGESTAEPTSSGSLGEQLETVLQQQAQIDDA